MNELYELATNPNTSLEERYAVIQTMKLLRRINPSNHLKRARKAERQRLYNASRMDWRYYPNIMTEIEGVTKNEK